MLEIVKNKCRKKKTLDYILSCMTFVAIEEQRYGPKEIETDIEFNNYNLFKVLWKLYYVDFYDNIDINFHWKPNLINS